MRLIHDHDVRVTLLGCAGAAERLGAYKVGCDLAPGTCFVPHRAQRSGRHDQHSRESTRRRERGVGLSEADFVGEQRAVMAREHLHKTPHTVDLMLLENNTTNPRSYLVRPSQHCSRDMSPDGVCRMDSCGIGKRR